MPRTKREGVFYGVVMAFTMSIFMNLLNTFLHAGVSMQSLGRALLLQPVIFAIVIDVESLRRKRVLRLYHILRERSIS